VNGLWLRSGNIVIGIPGPVSPAFSRRASRIIVAAHVGALRLLFLIGQDLTRPALLRPPACVSIAKSVPPGPRPRSAWRSERREYAAASNRWPTVMRGVPTQRAERRHTWMAQPSIEQAGWSRGAASEFLSIHAASAECPTDREWPNERAPRNRMIQPAPKRPDQLTQGVPAAYTTSGTGCPETR
jgi:hypothetical protein